jgi:hypothetical protein
VQNPFTLYLKRVDRTAFDHAQSAEPVGQFDFPVAPLFAPLLIGILLGSLLPTGSAAFYTIVGITLATAFVGWASVWKFYINRVRAYREQLGTERGLRHQRLGTIYLALAAVAVAALALIAIS